MTRSKKDLTKKAKRVHDARQKSWKKENRLRSQQMSWVLRGGTAILVTGLTAASVHQCVSFVQTRTLKEHQHLNAETKQAETVNTKKQTDIVPLFMAGLTAVATLALAYKLVRPGHAWDKFDEYTSNLADMGKMLRTRIRNNVRMQP